MKRRQFAAGIVGGIAGLFFPWKKTRAEKKPETRIVTVSERSIDAEVEWLKECLEIAATRVKERISTIADCTASKWVAAQGDVDAETLLVYQHFIAGSYSLRSQEVPPLHAEPPYDKSDLPTSKIIKMTDAVADEIEARVKTTKATRVHWGRTVVIPREFGVACAEFYDGDISLRMQTYYDIRLKGVLVSLECLFALDGDPVAFKNPNFYEIETLVG